MSSAFKAVASSFLVLCLTFVNLPNAFATRFPAHPTSAGTLAPSAWSVGRFPPRVWNTTANSFGRFDVLNIGVDALDGPTTRPPPFNVNFYNIQGREISFPSVQGAGVTVAGSLYIPASWNTSNIANTTLNRRSELLLQYTPLANDGFCPGNGDCFYYGAIGFSSAQITDQLAGGGPPRIRILKKGIADGWINLTTPFFTDAWNDMCVSFTGTTLEYYLNGTLVFTDTSLVPIDPSQGPPTRLRSLSVENYNFGSTFDARWSDLEYGPRASISITRSAAGSAIIGNIFSITSVVRNTGTSVATNVEVLEPAVANLTLVSVTGACTALPCSLGTLNPGDVRTYTSNYTVTGNATTVGNSASIRTDGVDCAKLDNTASITVGVGVGQSVQVPTLSIFGTLVLMLGLVALGARRNIDA